MYGPLSLCHGFLFKFVNQVKLEVSKLPRFNVHVAQVVSYVHLALIDASHIGMQAVPAANGTALLQVTVDASTRGGGVPERLYGSSILIVGDSNGNLAHASRIRLHFRHGYFMNQLSIVVVQALSSSRGRNIFHSGSHHIWRQA